MQTRKARRKLRPWTRGIAPLVVLSVTGTAQAQVEGSFDESQRAAPAPSAPPDPAAPPAPKEASATAAPPAKAEPEVSADKPEAMTPNDHRLELATRAGILFPGRMAPSNWLWVETNAAPLFAADLDWIVHPNVVLGAYFAGAPLSGERGVRTTYHSDTSGFFLSGGFSAKARFAVGDSLLLRGGLNFGRNAVHYSGKTDGSEFEATGGGFGAGLVADAVWRASKRIGASAQLGFHSQFGGSATVKGPPLRETGGNPDRSFGIAPIFFLTVGPEFFL